jgi:tetrathionate reductase subunit B
VHPAPQWRLAIDIERCTGCHACSVACKAEYRIPLGRFRTKVYYRDEGSFPAVRRHFLPAFCMQCADAPCLTACPGKAIARGGDGIVRIQADTCSEHIKHCGKACESACPYGAIYADPQAGHADKCDLCSDRLEASLAPTCVTACPTEALIFGDARDAGSPVRRFLASPRGATAVPIDRGGQPQVLYRAANPAVVAQMPKGHPHDPQSYEIDRWAGEVKS